MNSIALVSPPRHESVYHGSMSLYVIQSYIKKHTGELNAYLEQSSEWVDAASLPRSFLVEVHELLERSCRRMTSNDPDAPSAMVNHPVLLLYLIRMGHGVRISDLVSVARQSEFTGADEDTGEERVDTLSGFKDDIDELVRFCKRAETMTSSDEMRAAGMLTVTFYSAMRQPVQFFAPRETAIKYAHGKEYFLYAYDFDPSTHAQFVDIDDADTVAAFTRQGMPFHDSDTLDDATCVQVSEKGVEYIRRLLAVQEADVATGVAFDTGVPPSDPLVKLTDLVAGVRRLSSLPKSLSGEALRNALVALFTIKYNDARETWLNCMRGLDLDTEGRSAAKLNIQLADMAVAQCPVFGVGAYMESIALLRWFDSAAQAVTVDKFARGYARTVIRAIGNRYGVKSPVVRRFLLAADDDDGVRIPLDALGGHALFDHARLFQALATNWNDWFTLDIASPRGLWLCAHSPADGTRFSNYKADALLVHIFTHSDWFRERNLAGWRSESMDEWMVVHPRKWGSFRKVVPHHNSVAIDDPFALVDVASLPLGAHMRIKLNRARYNSNTR